MQETERGSSDADYGCRMGVEVVHALTMRHYSR